MVVDKFIRGIPVLLVLFVAGCATTGSDLSDLYGEAARRQSEVGNPVILIPGTLGSALVEEGTDAVFWGDFRGPASNAGTPAGARRIALPMKPGVPLADLRDDVISGGVIDDMKFSLLKFNLSIMAYKNILQTLGVAGYRDKHDGSLEGIDYGANHYTCFQFDYDWRRSNAENAALLDAFIQEKTAYVKQEKSKRGELTAKDIKFDLVAHSMGGLLTRYYLRYGAAGLPPDGTLPELTWAGAKQVERVILIGTPNAGSAAAFTSLIDGLYFPTVVKLPPAILGTFPSAYEVLPRTRHGPLVSATDETRKIDIMDPAAWELHNWGLANPKEDKVLQRLLPDIEDPAARRAIALDHLRKSLRNAQQFHAALDLPATPPDGVDIFLITGDAASTLKSLSVTKKHKLKKHRFSPGDGTVTRYSAVMDEREGQPWVPRIQSPIAWDQIIFLFSSHRGMTRSPEFTDNMLYLLLDKPRPETEKAETNPNTGDRI